MTARAPLPNVTYKVLVSPGPLIVVRLPLTGPRSRGKYPAPWREIVRAARAVLRMHGVLGRDLWSVDPLVGPEEHAPGQDDWPPRSAKAREESRRLALQADAAFEGDRLPLPKFWLYDWRDGAFVLVRRPSE